MGCGCCVSCWMVLISCWIVVFIFCFCFWFVVVFVYLFCVFCFCVGGFVMFVHVGGGGGFCNVLVVLCDQLRWDCLGFSSGGLVVSPVLDGLVGGGVLCERAFCVSPQCQPSRASLFTGRFPSAHRVWWNGVDLGLGEVCLGGVLRGVGFSTGYFGKLHFGGGVGVGEWFGFDRCLTTEDWLGGGGVGVGELLGGMGDGLWCCDFGVGVGGHDEWVVDRALEFVCGVREPWLCVVGLYGPHPPYGCPVGFSGWFGGCGFGGPLGVVGGGGGVFGVGDWGRLRSRYFGWVGWFDWLLGRLLGVVGGDTVVVFVSDHGDVFGEHGLFSKGLFGFDSVLRVPLVFRLPGVGACRFGGLVSLVDVVPTLLDFLGVGCPVGVQGRSLLGGFLGAGGWVGSGVVGGFIGWDRRLRLVRGDRWKYWVCGGEEVLFDVVGDPGELVNLVGVGGFEGVLSSCRLDLALSLIHI